MESFLDFKPLTPRLSSISIPTMILNGEFDFLTPRALHETLRIHIPDSALVIIPPAYHAFTLEQPALTADLLASFAEDVLAKRWKGNQSIWIAPDKREIRLCPFQPVRITSAPFQYMGDRDKNVARSAGRDRPGAVRQQTRVAAFLVSRHGAMPRQLAIALAWQVKANWHTELNAQFYREAEIVSLLRPAALLPVEAPAQDPFALSLRKIEFESGRVMQGQILFLKSSELLPLRDAVNAAVERRHLQVRRLWDEMLAGIGLERGEAQGTASPAAAIRRGP
jgi:hypothetical protein